jgi:hypothetical protein
MAGKTREILWALFGAATLAAYGSARGVFSTPGASDELHYRTSCSFAESNVVEGLVTNQSDDTYAVGGEARFEFLRANSISRPEILTGASGLIPGGQTARVSRARLAFVLQAGETCAFDAAKAIRKLEPYPPSTPSS